MATGPRRHRYLPFGVGQHSRYGCTEPAGASPSSLRTHGKGSHQHATPDDRQSSVELCPLIGVQWFIVIGQFGARLVGVITVVAGVNVGACAGIAPGMIDAKVREVVVGL